MLSAIRWLTLHVVKALLLLTMTALAGGSLVMSIIEIQLGTMFFVWGGCAFFAVGALLACLSWRPHPLNEAEKDERGGEAKRQRRVALAVIGLALTAIGMVVVSYNFFLRVGDDWLKENSFAFVPYEQAEGDGKVQILNQPTWSVWDPRATSWTISHKSFPISIRTRKFELKADIVVRPADTEVFAENRMRWKDSSDAVRFFNREAPEIVAAMDANVTTGAWKEVIVKISKDFRRKGVTLTNVRGWVYVDLVDGEPDGIRVEGKAK